MAKESILREKSYAFAVKMVRLYQHLSQEKREFVLSKQLLRSGTSVGANIEESVGGQSDRDFFTKLHIAYKEARESHYWLRLLADTGYLGQMEAQALMNDCEELIRMLGASIRTMREKFSS